MAGRLRLSKAAVALLLLNAMLIAGSIGVSIKAVSGLPASGEGPEEAVTKIEHVGIVCLAAAVSVLGSCLASGMALKDIAKAGFAASTERPEMRTYVLILAGLAEGIAIYGLLIAIMILGKV